MDRRKAIRLMVEIVELTRPIGLVDAEIAVIRLARALGVQREVRAAVEASRG